MEITQKVELRLKIIEENSNKFNHAYITITVLRAYID